MPMPEAPVDQDYSLKPRQNDVWSSRHSLAMASKSKTRRVQVLSHDDIRSRNFCFYCMHHSRMGLLINDIHRFSFCSGVHAARL